MPTLTLKFKDEELKCYEFEHGKTTRIGRADDNDVTIENLAVSSHHAKIDSVDDAYILTDLKSKNGTFVNDELVSSRLLKHGDVIAIAKHSLLFEYKEKEQRQRLEESETNRHLLMDTDTHGVKISKGTSTGSIENKSDEEIVGVLAYLSGGEGDIELGKKIVRVGKSLSADVVVGGFMVGKTAFAIEKKNSGYRLSYVAGISKPKVNGKKIRSSVRLKEFDTIVIGSATFQFYFKKF